MTRGGSATRRGVDGHTRAVRRLLAACVGGDVRRVTAVLHPAIVLVDDTDEPAPDRAPGRDAAALHLSAVLCPTGGIEVVQGSVNGRTGLVLRRGPLVVAVISVGVRRRRVDRIWITRQPDHLSDFNRKVV